MTVRFEVKHAGHLDAIELIGVTEVDDAPFYGVGFIYPVGKPIDVAEQFVSVANDLLRRLLGGGGVAVNDLVYVKGSTARGRVVRVDRESCVADIERTDGMIGRAILIKNIPLDALEHRPTAPPP